MTDPKNPSPKHGSAPRGNREAEAPNVNQSQPSVSQADGTAANAPRGETQAQPDKHGKDPQVESETPENRASKLNPSAPNEGTSYMPANTTRDSSGEVGEPTGEGNLDAPKENEKPGNDEQDIKQEKERKEDAA
jgi:hypothetical protein